MESRVYGLPFVRHDTDIVRRRAPYHQIATGLRHCVDWQMPVETPVLAMRDGVVASLASEFSKTYTSPEFADRTNYVCITHDDGERSYYVHLAVNSIFVTRGQRVNGGEIIALSGQTGYATYPHLHVGVYGKRWGSNIRIRWNRTIPNLSKFLQCH